MAIATESGYGAFLPKHKNELVNREALRGQMVKEASYLTGMDAVYAQLDEQARQFDLSLEQKESEFTRKLDFEYDALEAQAEHWDAQISLGWGKVRAGERIEQGKLDLAQDEMDFNRETRDMEMDFERDKLAIMDANYDATYGLNAGTQGGTTTTKKTADPYSFDQANFNATMKSGWIDIGGGDKRYSSGNMTEGQWNKAGGGTGVTGGSNYSPANEQEYYYPDTFVGAPIN